VHIIAHFIFLTLMLMAPLDSCGPRDGGPAAPPSRGAWCEWFTRGATRHQCSIHCESSRMAHGISKRKWAARSTPKLWTAYRNRV